MNDDEEFEQQVEELCSTYNKKTLAVELINTRKMADVYHKLWMETLEELHEALKK